LLPSSLSFGVPPPSQHPHTWTASNHELRNAVRVKAKTMPIA
jgi:hypothetical protein